MAILRILLLPISLVYWLVVKIRNWFFDLGIFRSVTPAVPTICVGNITVGGTGKTPHTEYLIRLLMGHYKLAVLSRGYRRATRGFVEADAASTALDIGDEPLQMKQKFPNVIIAVDENRLHGIAQLLEYHPDIDVVLLDDAFQHRAVRAGLSILLTNYLQPINRDFMLPTGHLRDSFAERKRADLVVVTKCPDSLDAARMQEIKRGLRLKPSQPVFYSRISYGPLKSFDGQTTTFALDGKISCVALCGIANPLLFIDYLEKNSKLCAKYIFSDHHPYAEREIRAIFAASNVPLDAILVSTEKDAARLRRLALRPEELQRIFYVEIKVEFIDNQHDTFNKKIMQYVSNN